MRIREYVVYFSLIAAMALTFALSAVPHVFAAGSDGPPLELVDSYPQDKGDHMPVQNVGIKLFFNKDSNVTDDSVWENNAKCFTLKDEKNKKIPIEAHYGTKESNYILVTAKPKGGRLDPNSDYTLTISDALTSTDERTLGEDVVIKFTTVDEAGNSKVYMLLMGVMVVGMIAMTVISNKRKAKAEAEVGAKAEKVNPYKLAKEKGISVEKAMALIEKDRQKQIARAGEARESQLKAAAEQEKLATKRVKGAHPISAGGSAYKTGRKAEAERKAKEEAAKKAKAEAAKRAKGTSHPKSKRGKGKYKR
ncbi:MAG: Ig-like domain-containing protein [Clostridiales Family XIII bacterium]|nr:Ig-like domain-containing protein [Clostridiales Family XIII bacterium]